MSFFGKIFTWWDGATVGTSLFTWRHGQKVGTDGYGNVYYTSKSGDRRWVVYNSSNDASRITADWYAWMHRMIDSHPDDALPPWPKFLKDPKPNLTGTASAYRPAGALEKGGQRAAASGDYEAWTPE